jgi:glucose-6-phosphate dehydrogenase assembly protein OpcA
VSVSINEILANAAAEIKRLREQLSASEARLKAQIERTNDASHKYTLSVAEAQKYRDAREQCITVLEGDLAELVMTLGGDGDPELKKLLAMLKECLKAEK